MAETGWLNPGTVSEIEEGPAWSDLANAGAEDGSNASCVLGVAEVSNRLKFENFNANLPVGATPVGVAVRYKRAYDSGSSSAPATTNLLMLAPGGAQDGEDKADIGTPWDADTPAFATAGGATDLWSLILDRATVNDSAFAVILSATPNGGLDNTVALIDVLQLKVYYSEGGGGPVMPIFRHHYKNQGMM